MPPPFARRDWTLSPICNENNISSIQLANSGNLHVIELRAYHEGDIDKMYELPFFASKSRLPAPLPPPEVIEGSGEIIQEQSGRRVIRFSDCYVIKYGLNVSLTEGQNMLFVRETQSVPVPEIFALYSTNNETGRKVNYIIMENISGRPLDTVWTQLDSSDKVKISNQLRTHLDILRSVPAPGYFGCIGEEAL
ncbi:hypothetical protein C2857_005637 [Epichloe festucae Fl1]|uniref:Aminoglycoside phosphotransferase domain-containing protein n=1 Tax=Epichloe festucae (strain Fl1) TaxID=877507 RepID=A0A7S9KL23_EPIFF|nr:hypothetical protein C2857_005637 [Epichloe festucae Fl1]